jgi:methionyl-tRNA formyltransferase
MKVVIITQNEPFYLVKNLEYLFKILPSNIKIVGCVVSRVSPFGKKESFLKKTFKTLNIFGIKFFLYYSIKFFISKFFQDSIYNFLNKKNIELIKTESDINSSKSLHKISSVKPDILVSILGNQIFKSNLISLAPKGCLNLHSALLPKYRGLMPTFWVLKNRETFTGVSVFFVDEGIDSGPIIVQKKIKINRLTQKQLIEKSKKIGMDAICEALVLISSNNFNLQKNDNLEKTYYSFPTKEDVKIFLKNDSKFF